MTTRTRYFVVASLLVLLVGLGGGLVAYYVGFPTNAFSPDSGSGELQFVPREATVVAFANVHEIMTSNLRERIRRALPDRPNGQEQFRNQTGINVETDVDRIVACLTRHGDDNQRFPASGLVIARGRFDEVRIEALMRGHGATAEDYNGKRLITAEHPGNGGGLSLAFIEPGLVGIGGRDLVRNAIDLKDGGQSLTTNDEMMNLVRSLDGGNAWAVGRFDVLVSQARLPSGLAAQLPPITWFAASGYVNGGLSGVVRADSRDEASADNLRDIVRGFLALAKLQTASRPEMQTLLQSLELGGTGTTVALSFNVPAEIFDLLGPMAGRGRPQPR